MCNALTIDVEDWFHAHVLDIKPELWSGLEDRVANNTAILLNLLAACNIKATFFVLGCVANKHPALIKRIASDGHEIGSHGYWHSLVYKQNRQEFRRDVRDAKDLLEELISREVKVYRAPSWSISADTLWALEVLEEEGFSCDSSIQPFATPLSGIKGMPTVPFRPVLNGRKLNLREFPPTVLKFKMGCLPFAGGFYLRAVPLGIVKWALAKVNKTGPGLVYVHPWEVDPCQPRRDISPLAHMVQYYNLKSTQYKLEELFRSFKFAPLSEVMGEQDLPCFSLETLNANANEV